MKPILIVCIGLACQDTLWRKFAGLKVDSLDRK